MNLTSPVLKGAAACRRPARRFRDLVPQDGRRRHRPVRRRRPRRQPGPADVGTGRRRGRAGGGDHADRLFPQRLSQRARYRPARPRRRAGARASGLRGLRHAPCRAGLSRHQPDKTRGRIRNPAAEGSSYPASPTPRSNCIPTGTRRWPRSARWHPTSDGRSVLRGSVQAGIPDHRPHRGPQSAGPAAMPVQAAACGKPDATPISSGPGISPIASSCPAARKRAEQNDALRSVIACSEHRSTTAVMPREAGHPVRRSLSIHRDCSGILDHPLSRAMTAVHEFHHSDFRKSIIAPEGTWHARISPDPDFRYPSCPPLPKPHRQFSSLSPNTSTQRARISSSTAATLPSTAPTSRDDLEFAQDAACRAAGALPLSARQSRCRRQPDRARAGAVAADDRTGPEGLSLGLRRRPLALRGGRLVFYRAQCAGHEYRPCERGRAVRLAGVAACRRSTANRSRCFCTSRFI